MGVSPKNLKIWVASREYSRIIKTATYPPFTKGTHSVPWHCKCFIYSILAYAKGGFCVPAHFTPGTQKHPFACAKGPFGAGSESRVHTQIAAFTHQKRGNCVSYLQCNALVPHASQVFFLYYAAASVAVPPLGPGQWQRPW